MKKNCRAAILKAVIALTGLPLFGGPPIVFRDATGNSGIQFLHTDGSFGKRYIMETVASGLGLVDSNNDGWEDIYFLNGAPLPGGPVWSKRPTNALYRNNHDGTFTDVTLQSGA